MRHELRRTVRGDWASRLPLLLGVVFAIEVVALGWSPRHRGDWLLENLIVIPVAMLLIICRRRIALSSSSWISVFAFFALHEVGSHYTYSFVPWTDWGRDLFGWSADFERNHFDRFVHFAFGLLLTRPLGELIRPRIDSKPGMLRLLTICLVMTLSSLYELLEWTAALIFDPGLGIAFVGAQGDVWDSQKDQSLALIGSVLASALPRLSR